MLIASVVLAADGILVTNNTQALTKNPTTNPEEPDL
jgi:hypothetical protein